MNFGLQLFNNSVALERLRTWIKVGPNLSKKQLAKCVILEDDLIAALKSVQPSAKREGFATVPGVTWEDVGSLVAIREHLKMTILVGNFFRHFIVNLLCFFRE